MVRIGKHTVRYQYAGIQIPAGSGCATGSSHRHAGDFRLHDVLVDIFRLPGDTEQKTKRYRKLIFR